MQTTPSKKSSFKLLRATRKVVCSRNHVCRETTAQLASRTVTREKFIMKIRKKLEIAKEFSKRKEVNWVESWHFQLRWGNFPASDSWWPRYCLSSHRHLVGRTETFPSAASIQWCKQYISLSVSKASSPRRIVFCALVRLLPTERKIICSISFLPYLLRFSSLLAPRRRCLM